MTYKILTISGIDGAAWANPTYIETEDNLWALYAASPDITTEWLAGQAIITNQIPSDSTITGIEVRLKKWNPDDLNVYDSDVVIMDASDWSIISDNKASGVRWLSTPFSETYGNSSDMWGSSVTSTFINSGNFAIGFRGIKVGGSLMASIELDYFEIKIHYEGGVAPVTNQYGPRAQAV